jgi:hypothetical protein
MRAISKLAVIVCLLALVRHSYAQEPSDIPQQPGQTPASAQTPSNPLTSLPKTVSARPFTISDKLDYRVVQSLGLRGFGGASVSAAIGQARNSPYEWGQGAEGFTKRFASGFAGNMTRQTFAFALESAFHEDPRYFPSKDKSGRERILNALKQVVVCKTDRGTSEFAWARVMSGFAAGQFVNIWQPASINGVSNGITRSLIGFGGDFAYNMMQEFIPFTRPRSIRHHH